MTSPLLFQELIDRLRREDFPVGPDQVLRMYALLSESEEVSPEELKTLLCPIFATNSEEQLRFYRAYDEFFSIPVPAAASRLKRRTLSIPMPRSLRSIPGTVEVPEEFPWKRFAVPAMVVLLTVVLLGAIVAKLWKTEEPPVVPDPGTVTETTTTTESRPPEQKKKPAPNPWIYALAISLGLLGAEVGRTVVRWLQQKQRSGEGRPFDWPLRDAAPPSIFATSSFYRASRLLKGRELAEHERLDVRRTIDATIRALGDPTFAYALDRRASEYLILIERLSDRDHLAALATTMAQALARDGVLLEVYEYQSDPRFCTKTGSTVRLSTADLPHRFPQHRLIVIGTATPFTDPVTGQAHEWIPRAFPWTWRALLTPDDECSAAGFVEPWFDVFALLDNGLLRLAERWQYPDASSRPILRARPDYELPDELPSSVRGMEAALDARLFAWVLRCAVHPTLQWDLTRALAPPMPDDERLRGLLTLSRLPWFRQGRIPEPLRLALVRRLGENKGENDAARSVALTLLASTPAPPANSVAARTLEIEQLTHQLWRARGDRAELRPLIRGLRRFPPRLIARDRALMQLLRDDMPGQPVARKLPQLARRLLYRQGIPAFGAHSFIGLLLIVPMLLMAATQVTREPVSGQAPPSTVSTTDKTFDTTPPETMTETIDTMITELPNNSEPFVPDTEISQGQELTLISPEDGETLRLDRDGGIVQFRWSPEGDYTLYIWDGEKPVVARKVSGTSWVWSPPAGNRRWTWSMKGSAGIIRRVPFAIVWESMNLMRQESVEREYTVGCGSVLTDDTVAFNLATRERVVGGTPTIVREDGASNAKVEIVRVNPSSLTVRYSADVPVPVVDPKAPFRAQRPCRPGKITVQVTATIRRSPAATAE